MTKQILTCVLFFYAWINIAFSLPLLDSCIPVPFKIENKNIILLGNPEQPKTSQIYFFTNKSTQSVFIDHPKKNNPGVSAGWTSYLRPGNWSAILLTRSSFEIQCSMIEPGKVIPLDCAKTLTVCTPKNLVTKTNVKGNYWLVEDKNWENLISGLKKRGVHFSEPMTEPSNKVAPADH